MTLEQWGVDTVRGKILSDIINTIVLLNMRKTIPYVLPKQAWRKETPNKKVKTYYKLILGEKAHHRHIREDA